MGPTTLLASGMLALAITAGLGLTAYLAARRTRAAQTPLVGFMFAMFWLGAATVTLSGGLRSLLAWSGHDSFALVRALEQVTTPAYALSAACLVIYVLYLRTGSARLATFVGLYHLALIPLVRYQVERAQPIGYEVTAWQVNYVYATPLHTPLYGVTLALLAGPALASLVGYALLSRTVADASTRYRIACISVGMAAWILVEVVAFATPLASVPAGEWARRGAALVGVGISLAGYLPPAWARRRWGARSALERPATRA